MVKSHAVLLVLAMTVSISIIFSLEVPARNETKEVQQEAQTSVIPVRVVTIAPTRTPPPEVIVPIVKELMQDGYVNTESVAYRSLPEIREDTVLGSLPIGTKVNITGSYEFEGEKWYKTEKGSYVYSKYISLDPTGARSGMSRGSFERDGINIILTEKSALTKDQIEYLLEGGGMEGLSDVILYSERIFGVNAMFIISVGKLESADGNSRLARTKNNLFGVNAYGDVEKNARVYSSKNVSIYDFSKLIKKYYFDEGLTNLDSIGKKYCENREWPDLIRGVIRSNENKLENYVKDNG